MEQKEPTMDPSKRELSIILVSDIHMALKKLELLKTWYTHKNSPKVDYVLGLGDFHNLNPKTDQTNEEVRRQSEKDVASVLTFLEFFNAPIIWIPGNHDSKTFFTPDAPPLTENSTLIHGKSLMIAPGLQVIGWGGSIPGYQLDENSKSMVEVWEGYPYKNDEEYKKDILPMVEKHCKEDVQTLLLTHIGPNCSTTTIGVEGNKPHVPVISGSDVLSDILKNQKYNILGNFHGHTHEGLGRTNCGRTVIVNPGSLAATDFAIIRFSRTEAEKRWRLLSLEMLDLGVWEQKK